MLNYSLLGRIPKHIGKIKILILLLSLLPLLILITEFYIDELGIDPLDRLTRFTGKTALVLLILSLVITPLRHFLIILMVSIGANYGKRLADWNWIIKLRRIIGVMSFFYVLLHFIIYFWLDQGADIGSTFYDIQERNFIAVGLISFLLLIPLALTSTNNMMRLLGKKWRKLHRSVYLILILAIAHYWMLSKTAVYDYFPYLIISFLLLSWRVWYYGIARKNKLIDDGMEAIDREKINRIINNLNFLANKTFGENEGKVIVSILFYILSSESHYSESILCRNNEIMDENNIASETIMKRLQLSRKNSKDNIKLRLIIGMQTTYIPELFDLVDQLDNYLKDGVCMFEHNDEKALSEAWTKIFSLLMPVS